MNFLSFFRHLKIIVAALFSHLLIVALAPLFGCYSFTGASVPPHLKTLQIPTAEDASGFGEARYRETLTATLVKNFRSDNSFRLVQENPDATVAATITSITDATASVNPNELEKTRKATVLVKVVYSDLVKKRPIWDKPFTQYQNYEVAEGFQGRDAAIQKALQRIADEIALAVVSGW